MPVALALFLLAPRWRESLRVLGLTGSRPGHDLLVGTGLAALIGIPGLALYVGGRLLGLSAEVVASALNTHWWTVPILILAALKNAVLEEVIVVGYLITRLEQLRWGPVAIIATSSLLRGSYHRSEEHTSELQSRGHLVCRLLLEKKEIAIADK